MALTLTYADDLSRVRITADSLGNAAVALVERSTDQITWTIVRGGRRVLIAGGQATLDDYEFAPNVPNYYRVTTAADITHVGTGAAAQADNAPVTPALPAGLAAGDTMFLLAGHHNDNATANTPAGWQLLRDLGPLRLFGKTAIVGETAPNVTWAGGTAGPCGAQICAFRNTQLVIEGFASLLSPTAGTNIPYNGFPVSSRHPLILYCGWKRANWASVDTLTPRDGGTPAEIGEFTTFLSGIGQGVVWDWMVQTSIDAVSISNSVFVVNGGSTAARRSIVVSVPATPLVQTGQIVPVIDRVWLKSPARPNLNMPITPAGQDPFTRPARQGIFPIMGRTLPIAVGHLRLSRQYTLLVHTQSQQERAKLNALLSIGDTLLLHVPPAANNPHDRPAPSMYVAIGEVEESWRIGLHTLPLVEVAAPNPDLIGSTVTWQDVINTYATWADLLADKPTWQAVLEIIGSGTDIPVP